MDGVENLKGGYVTIIWEANLDTAEILIQGASSGPTISERGIRVFQSAEQVSFVVNYSGLSIWLYSIYPSAKKLVASEHSAGRVIDTGGALVKSFKGECDVSVK